MCDAVSHNRIAVKKLRTEQELQVKKGEDI